MCSGLGILLSFPYPAVVNMLTEFILLTINRTTKWKKKDYKVEREFLFPGPPLSAVLMATMPFSQSPTRFLLPAKPTHRLCKLPLMIAWENNGIMPTLLVLTLGTVMKVVKLFVIVNNLFSSGTKFKSQKESNKVKSFQVSSPF
jgi:hypothetical protein